MKNMLNNKKLKNITGFVLLAAICLTLLVSCVGPGLSEYSFRIADERYEILLVARDIRFIQKKM